MTNYPTVSAIIPCYNEGKYVGRVIEVLLESSSLAEIIAINDGSTDESDKILSSFGHKIIFINFKKNHGKAAAVVAGIKKATGDLLLFIDADLCGLKTSHVEKMVNAYLKNKTDGVIANFVDYHDNSSRFFYWDILGKFYHKIIPYDPLIGERLYPRKTLLPWLSQMKNLGYGLEVFLNHKFKDKKIKVVRLKNIFQPPKEEKNGFNYTTLRIYLKEGLEISKELAHQQGIKGREIIEFQRKYLRQFVQTYMKSGRKWKKLFNKYILSYLDIT